MTTFSTNTHYVNVNLFEVLKGNIVITHRCIWTAIWQPPEHILRDNKISMTSLCQRKNLEVISVVRAQYIAQNDYIMNTNWS
jgi:hypothetical protein